MYPFVHFVSQKKTAYKKKEKKRKKKREKVL